ncbi:hypothetical protein [Streptomyces sp. V1I6]|uniref:hypothetical protein n=1 Tax=Streptomyces sp. V1I6 TaxID=3042273 RepID=UPI00278627E8|nr:hypothetical protein [Streptomyces sp. V1I6]MDQ0846485.1 hypothetical protein [Streptomyces sp. V1I6]
MLDHRLVQTAVIGHKNSDHPVILPMEVGELDRWRKAHPTYTYWCGLQLGGCGGELSDRRYTTKVCHFAHHRTAPVCHRRNNGESSADHLFIKRGVQNLLGKRKLRGQVKTRDLGTGPGDAVDVHLPDSRRRLRFQLTPVDYRTWRRAEDELAEDADDIDWIFADEGPITQHFLGRRGYCLRVRCQTAGGERRVHIGAEGRDRKVSWTPLEDCVLTPTGIVTPDTERIHLSRARPTPAAFPLLEGLVFAPAPHAAVPDDSPFVADDRLLLAADLKPAGSPIVRGLISLPLHTGEPPHDHVYRVTGAARLLVGEETDGWAVEVKKYVRLNAHDAQKTGLWTPPATPAPVVPPPRKPELVAPEPQRKSEPARNAASAPVDQAPAAPAVLTRPELVTALRDALAQRARLQSTTTWETLVRTVSPALAKYSDTGRMDLLVAVDTPLREHVPILSALIRDHGQRPLPYLSRVLSELGVPHASSSVPIRRWAVVETDRAFAAYGVPSRAMPPRLSLLPTQPVTNRPTTAIRKTTSSRSLGLTQLQRPSARQQIPQRHRPVRTAPDTSTVRRLRSLVATLEGLLPTLGKAARKKARKALVSPQDWLAVHDGAVPPQVAGSRHHRSDGRVLRPAGRASAGGGTGGRPTGRTRQRKAGGETEGQGRAGSAAGRSGWCEAACRGPSDRPAERPRRPAEEAAQRRGGSRRHGDDGKPGHRCLGGRQRPPPAGPGRQKGHHRCGHALRARHR